MCKIGASGASTKSIDRSIGPDTTAGIWLALQEILVVAVSGGYSWRNSRIQNPWGSFDASAPLQGWLNIWS